MNITDKEKKGLLLYGKEQKLANSIFHIDIEQETSTSHYDLITCSLLYNCQWKTISFAYIHPKASTHDYELVAQLTKTSDIIIGDLNIDTRKDKYKRFETFLQNTDTKSILTEKTHRDGGQIDHCLIKKSNETNLMHATSFASLYSDHNAIVLRIALDPTDNVKELPLTKPLDERYARNTENTDDDDISTGKVKTIHIKADDKDDELPNANEPLIPHKHMQRIINNRWLTDTTIEALFKLITEDPKTKKTYAFSTKFYTKLKKAKFNYAKSVKSWTKDTDIFTNELLLFPIHDISHWILITAHINQQNIRLTLHDPYDQDKRIEMLNHIESYLQKEYE